MTAREDKWDESVGKKLGVTGKTMAKSCRRAKKSYENLKDKGHVKDKGAYVAGTAIKIAKNKVKAEDLVALGIAPAVVIEIMKYVGVSDELMEQEWRKGHVAAFSKVDKEGAVKRVQTKKEEEDEDDDVIRRLKRERPDLLRAKEKKEDRDADSVFGAIFISEVLKLESGQTSTLLEANTYEPTNALSSLLTEDIAGTNSLTRWRKLLPSCPEFLVKLLASTT